MGRALIWDHRHNVHTTVSLTDERREALNRVAHNLGVSQHALLQRFITVGLLMHGEDTQL